MGVSLLKPHRDVVRGTAQDQSLTVWSLWTPRADLEAAQQATVTGQGVLGVQARLACGPPLVSGPGFQEAEASLECTGPGQLNTRLAVHHRCASGRGAWGWEGGRRGFRGSAAPALALARGSAMGQRMTRRGTQGGDQIAGTRRPPGSSEGRGSRRWSTS